MSVAIPLRCRCGAVRGELRTTPSEGNHVVCHCDDCQAFARHLGRADTLDASGGTEIFQATPAQLSITQGLEQLRCLRLSPKGLLRWYTACCSTPVGNTLMKSRVPFVGLLGAFIDPAASPELRERGLGPVLLRAFPRFATGPVAEPRADKLPPSFFARTLWLLAKGFAAGKHQPSVFFARGASTPRVAPVILTREQRAAANARVGASPAPESPHAGT